MRPLSRHHQIARVSSAKTVVSRFSGRFRAKFVVTPAHVLNKSVSGADHSDRAQLFKATHQPQPGLKPIMICFDKVITALLSDMASSGHQLIEHPRISRCFIRRHRARVGAVIQSPGNRPASGRQVSLFGHQYVDDLAILVDRSIQVDPAPGNLHIRSVGKPPITGHMPAGLSRVDQQRSEPLHPPKHRNTVT